MPEPGVTPQPAYEGLLPLDGGRPVEVVGSSTQEKGTVLKLTDSLVTTLTEETTDVTTDVVVIDGKGNGFAVFPSPWEPLWASADGTEARLGFMERLVLRLCDAIEVFSVAAESRRPALVRAHPFAPVRAETIPAPRLTRPLTPSVGGVEGLDGFDDSALTTGLRGASQASGFVGQLHADFRAVLPGDKNRRGFLHPVRPNPGAHGVTAPFAGAFQRIHKWILTRESDTLA